MTRSNGTGGAPALPAGEAMPAEATGLRKTIRQKVVSEMTSLSPIQCWRGERAGTFPKSFKVSPGSRAKAWFLDEIIAYQRERDLSRKAWVAPK